MPEFYQDFKLGVLGGGQLGRMLIQSAVDFNLDVFVIDPDPEAPCKNVATGFQAGSITDFETVYNFGKNTDLLTIEIENVNTEALKKLEKEGKKVYPQPWIIELVQDKVRQKNFYKEKNIPTAEFMEVSSREQVLTYADDLPVVNKLAREGYDGRGVQILKKTVDLKKAFDAPGLLESYVNFQKEISVIVARNRSGEIKSFPPVELVFHPEANLVEYLFSPAQISEEVLKESMKVATDVILKLDMVGLLAVEMFVTRDEKILVNEIAPRTHNSGHQTIEGNKTSQFEQHLRSILNLPLGDTGIKIPSAMVNILGEDGFNGMAKYEGLEDVLKVEGAHIHLYGKKLTKPFRKMGHVTIIDEDIGRLRKKAEFIKSKLKVIS